MKVTKRQLRRIIKEEKQKLQEKLPAGSPGREQRMKAYVDLIGAVDEYVDRHGLEAAIDALQMQLGELEDELERSEMDEEF